MQPLCGIQVTFIRQCKNLGSSDCGPSISADFTLHSEMVYSYYIFSLKTSRYMNISKIFESCKLSAEQPFPMCPVACCAKASTSLWDRFPTLFSEIILEFLANCN